jgi:hypothetical protein
MHTCTKGSLLVKISLNVLPLLSTSILPSIDLMWVTLYCFCHPQDTPGVKSSYSAAVRAPLPLVALMSAVPSDGPPPLGKSGGNATEGVPHLSDVTPEGPTKVHYYSQQVSWVCRGWGRVGSRPRV